VHVVCLFVLASLCTMFCDYLSSLWTVAAAPLHGPLSLLGFSAGGRTRAWRYGQEAAPAGWVRKRNATASTPSQDAAGEP
jgi:hypothetical protein